MSQYFQTEGKIMFCINCKKDILFYRDNSAASHNGKTYRCPKCNVEVYIPKDSK